MIDIDKIIEILIYWKREDLANLLGVHETHVFSMLKLTELPTSTKVKLREDDTNYRWHQNVETMGRKLPDKQRAIIHQRIFDGAYESILDLNESLKLAVDNPELVEKIVKATSPIDRQMIEFGATTKPERAERKFMPKATPEEKELDYEKRVARGLVSALNQVNMGRILWERTDAIDLLKKHLTKKQMNQVIDSVETVVRVWSKTLRELK